MTRILRLNTYGIPIAWISKTHAATLYAKDMIVWEYGKNDHVIYGGIQQNGVRSSMEMSAVVAVYGKSKNTLALRTEFNNRMLFKRDNYHCMYCGYQFPPEHLTCDHVVPKSKGGKNRWENVVSACKRCNHLKADHLLEELDMALLAIPFRPNIFEAMYLSQHTILRDQMDYLATRFSGNRIWRAA